MSTVMMVTVAAFLIGTPLGIKLFRFYALVPVIGVGVPAAIVSGYLHGASPWLIAATCVAISVGTCLGYFFGLVLHQVGNYVRNLAV
jgi:hypothetical protein